MWELLLRYGLLLQLSIASAEESAHLTCEQAIQDTCLFARAASSSWQACGECAKAHQRDLRNVCSSDAQVERFCKSTKPVIGGFDVVQYFSLQPGDFGVLGSPEFAHNLTSPDKDGSPRFTYEFWFKNTENRDKFAVNPWKYAPKNGGF